MIQAFDAEGNGANGSAPRVTRADMTIGFVQTVENGVNIDLLIMFIRFHIHLYSLNE